MDDHSVKPTSAPHPPEPPSVEEPPAPPIAPIPTSAPASTLGPLATQAPAESPLPEAESAVTLTPALTPPRPAAARPGVDHALDPRSIKAHRLRLFITTGLLAGLTLLIVVGILAAEGLVLWAPALWLLGVLLLLARAWWWPGVRYRHISYRIDDRSLVIRRGVWWRSVAWVPRSRVQHTDVTQGPVERHFGLGTLIVHTAGTQFAAVPLSGLAHETASAIRDLLIEETSDDDAV
ncbi:MAG: PH domain-containing protein [Acidobacteriota bacterium]